MRLATQEWPIYGYFRTALTKLTRFGCPHWLSRRGALVIWGTPNGLFPGRKFSASEYCSTRGVSIPSPLPFGPCLKNFPVLASTGTLLIDISLLYTATISYCTVCSTVHIHLDPLQFRSLYKYCYSTYRPPYLGASPDANSNTIL